MALKPPVEVPQGAIRLNTDSQKLEFFAQDQWWQMATDFPTLDGGARGVWFGGWDPGPSVGNVIDYITISTVGNATDFGDLQEPTRESASGASRVRGVVAGGAESPGPQEDTNRIDYITFSTTGNATNFGDLTRIVRSTIGASNGTRMVSSGGRPESQSPNPYKDIIDYITIATTGNAVDFGDLSDVRRQHAACASPTRILWWGGNHPSDDYLNIIEYNSIASTGNATDFGDCVEGNKGAACSNSTLGVKGGGKDSQQSNVIEYVLMASKGDATDFGDLTRAHSQIGACSSPTRGVWGGGAIHPNYYDVMDYVSFHSKGNATDFGNLTVNKNFPVGASNAHGGL